MKWVNMIKEAIERWKSTSQIDLDFKKECEKS
jgi:hypothetical protein